MNFTELNLNKPLLNALADLDIDTPTPIQEKVFSTAMSGKDIVGIAQTGTGKTLAYLLPCLRLWNYTTQKHPQILIIVPTRELVVQVEEVVASLIPYTSIRVGGVYGGVNMNRHVKLVEGGLDVVVATPGRLMDLALCGALKLKNIKRFIIDEVDEMLNLGFRTQLNMVFDLLPKKRQNLMFSATITEEVEKLIDATFFSPVRIEAAPTGTPLENIDQIGYRLPNFNTKANLLESLLTSDETMTKVMIFCSTKALADILYNRLDEKFEETVGVIHSNKAQNKRFNTVIQFASGDYKYLIATDIVARGLDISEVSHVVNFDIPDTPENYMHRIGRTGRKDRKGQAITFIGDSELGYLTGIEGLMKMSIPINELPDSLEITDVLIELEKPIVRMPEVTRVPKREVDNGAFHEKSEKNSQQNFGDKKYHRELKKKYKRPKHLRSRRLK
jgi:ATP-dependent RNA helicase RhlE